MLRAAVVQAAEADERHGVVRPHHPVAGGVDADQFAEGPDEPRPNPAGGVDHQVEARVAEPPAVRGQLQAAVRPGVRAEDGQ